MNILILVWNYLRARPLNTALNVTLLSLGIAVITLLLILQRQLEEKITDNARGIDLVVGAKGSPLQLILCNIFHIDYPTGNIQLAEAERIARHRLIRKAIPLALGDSYRSFRIVGTNSDYPALYDASLHAGKWYAQSFEVTAGADAAATLGLKIGDRFQSAHGLAEGGHAHNEHEYRVVGILKPTYSVIDNLLLTSVESVWEMHEEHPADSASARREAGVDDQHDHGDHEDEPAPSTEYSRLVPSVPRGDTTRQITAMLIKYRSPMGAITLPRQINAESRLQAASPAFETARLFSILGAGIDILLAFAYVLIVISALSIFIALYNSLKERRYDLAIMRSMGASRSTLFLSILLEGGVLTLFGSLLGVAMGHAIVIALPAMLPQLARAGVEGTVFYPAEGIILVGSLLLGMACAALPAIQAYRTDISRVLAGN